MTLLVLIATAVGLGLWMQSCQTALRTSAPLLAVTFAHKDHTETNCLVCHHNFADNTGNGLCFDCHRTHEDVAALREAQFHGLCRDCHAEKRDAGEEHGPLRECSGCHVADQHP